MLTCISHIKEMMLFGYFVCTLTGPEHDDIDWTQFTLSLFHITLDGWHVGIIWCTSICRICEYHYEIPLRGSSYQHRPQRSWWHTSELRDSSSTRGILEYVSHKLVELYLGYMTWLYSMSHPIMTLDASGCSPRPAHEEVLENEQAWNDHVIDLLQIY